MSQKVIPFVRLLTILLKHKFIIKISKRVTLSLFFMTKKTILCQIAMNSNSKMPRSISILFWNVQRPLANLNIENDFEQFCPRLISPLALFAVLLQSKDWQKNWKEQDWNYSAPNFYFTVSIKIHSSSLHFWVDYFPSQNGISCKNIFTRTTK